MIRRICFSLLLIFSFAGPLSAQSLVTEVFPLGYRTANEITPVLRPLVSPGGSISGISGQLVVTATPSQMNEVRRLLATLDKAPARLLITVRRERSTDGQHDSATVHARTDNVSINNGRAVSGKRLDDPRKESGESASIRLESQRWSEGRGIVQRVQTLEGREAYISIGEEIPVRNRGVAAGPSGVYRYDSTSYYPAVTGFYAVTRVKGDRVYVDISTTSHERTGKGKIRSSRETYGQRHAPIATANLLTSASGKLGEWLAIGAVDQNNSSRQIGILAAGKQASASLYGIYLKVDMMQGNK